MRKLCLCLLLLWGLVDTGHSRNVFQMSIQETEITKESVVYQEDTVQTDDVAFAFAKHFQNNMVLQMAPARANIYGFSPDIGQKVIAQMNTPSKPYYYETMVKESAQKGVGVWMITLDPIDANVTVSVRVMSERGTLNLANVIFGDVWLCSGQSNMQFSVPQMFNSQQEIADAHKYPNIRLMTVSMRQSPTPLDDLIAIEEAWTSPSNNTVGHSAWTYFSAVCWLYGKHIHTTMGIPVGLVASDWGGTPVEAWSSPDSLKKCGVTESADSTEGGVESNLYTSENLPNPGEDDLRVGGPELNSVLWNAMIHPLLGMTLRGAIWYQGENDATTSTKMNRYNCTFPGMIADWREKFSQVSQQTNPQFPFGFVQLAGYRPAPLITVGFPDIRWHQTADVGYVPNPKMPNVFMAVAMDLPDFNSTYGAIHPRDKTDVGLRLALGGLALAYEQSTFYQGPFPVKGAPSSAGYELDYGSTWILDVRDKDGFEFFCEPSTKDGSAGHWVPTVITASNATSVVLYPAVCGSGEVAVGLRYAWRETPCNFKQCPIYSSLNELPAAPFVFLAESGKKDVRFTGPFGEGRLQF
ncbi:sialate O-acetylesterase [Aplysia californica]|uniref:Sialate O-acetylesterase n=1 Tax=Aplysia californica TaxID=6500 RepID=A0ABM1A7T6_APLCA|nr:sialate O-acetylesterase [Aplysia californica]